MIARDCLLAGHVGSRLHVCHVSTAGSVELVRWAKGKGWSVTAEVTPHHLLLTDELVSTYDPLYKVNPPLRTADDVEAVRAGLADGTIDCVATDHAPHPTEDKECEWAAAAMGMLGLETALSVVQQAMVDTGMMTGPRWPTGCRYDRPGSAGRRPRPAAARRLTGPPDPGGPVGAPRRRPGRVGVAVAQHAVRGHGAARGGRRDVPGRAADSARREAAVTATTARCVAARTGGRAELSRRVVRRARRDHRGGGLRDRDDGVPGDADRPLVPPAGRRDDGAARRQHRRQRHRRRVRPHLGRRVRRPGPGQDGQQLARAPQPRRRARRHSRSSGSAASTPGR